nr:hypothetical protein [Tanacetum cinerariifolium]
MLEVVQELVRLVQRANISKRTVEAKEYPYMGESKASGINFASWIVNNKFYSDNVVWLIQLIYKIRVSLSIGDLTPPLIGGFWISEINWGFLKFVQDMDDCVIIVNQLMILMRKQSGYNILRAVGLWRVSQVERCFKDEARVNVLEWHPLLEL